MQFIILVLITLKLQFPRAGERNKQIRKACVQYYHSLDLPEKALVSDYLACQLQRVIIIIIIILLTSPEA